MDSYKIITLCCVYITILILILIFYNYNIKINIIIGANLIFLISKIIIHKKKINNINGLFIKETKSV